ncbi:MAG: multidrug effflux MFS transporter [Verrucomicrobiota bacterium JB022]|nr:multidrug effflux MFS transporter [Verrucomicrobiota bacterium JB022]
MSTDARHSSSPATSLRFTALLASVTALTSLSIDAYLPAFPDMAAYFDEPISKVSATVGVYMWGIAVGQLIGGYLSDRFRRKHILLAGLFIFILSCIGIATQTTLQGVYILRFFQALGGGFAIVSVPAIIRDRVSGNAAAKLFGMVGLITMCAPAAAPSLGTLILEFADWHGVFIFLTLYAIVVSLALMRGLKPATHHIPTMGKLTLVESFSMVLKNPLALHFVGVMSMCYSVVLIFVTNASMLYQEHFAASKRLFSILFAANIATMICSMLVSRSLIGKVRPVKVLRTGVLIQSVTLIGLCLAYSLRPELTTVVPFLMISVGIVGAIGPNVQACFLEFFPRNAGVAASILGTLQFLISGALSTASAWVSGEYGVLPLFGLMATCATLALVSAWPTPQKFDAALTASLQA